MKFKIDENLPSELADDLRNYGHEADSVVDEGLAGTPDNALMQIVKSESRVFLTLDKGIADLRAYRPNEYRGIVLFRPQTQGRGAVREFVRRYLPILLERDLTGHLFVVTERGIRVR